MDIYLLIGFSVMAAALTLAIIDIIRVRFANRKLVANAGQLAIDKLTLLMRVSELSAQKELKSVEQTEGFLKFLTDSRQWAFDYIEEVQKEIGIFALKAGPYLYFREVTEEEREKVITAYDKLLSVLPDREIKEQ